MKSVAFFALLLLLIAPVSAQSPLTGKWEGKTPNNFEMVLELSAKDGVLTGTFTRNGESAELTDGRVSKDTFTFQVAFNGQTARMTGELRGDEIRIWMDQQGPTRATTLKRTNDK
jgi:hypothetical protein